MKSNSHTIKTAHRVGNKHDELISKAQVDQMLKRQEQVFQAQLKQQYEYFQTLISGQNQVESPKFCNEVSKSAKLGVNLVTASKKVQFQNFSNNVRENLSPGLDTVN